MYYTYYIYIYIYRFANNPSKVDLRVILANLVKYSILIRFF